MSWANAMAAIGTNLTAAGATISPAIKTVVEGEPDTVNVPAYAYWYAGDRDSATGGNTFGKTNIEEGVEVTVYWPGSVRFPSGNQTVERWLHDATRAAKHALWTDIELGGNAIGLDIDETVAGWASIGGTLCRIATFVVWVDEAWVDDIAP